MPMQMAEIPAMVEEWNGLKIQWMVSSRTVISTISHLQAMEVPFTGILEPTDKSTTAHSSNVMLTALKTAELFTQVLIVISFQREPYYPTAHSSTAHQVQEVL